MDKEVEIIVGNKSFKHYKDLNYFFSNKGQAIIIKVGDLLCGSDIKINVKCDICEKEKNIKYQAYIKNTKNLTQPYCCCYNCAKTKLKETINKNYNVEHIFQSEIFKNKRKETNLEKYGDENYVNIEEIKLSLNNKSQEEKELIYKKREQTCLKNYGVNFSMQNKNVQQKSKSTCLEKYGVEYPTQNEEIFNKAQISGKKIKFHKQTGLQYRGKNELHFLDYCFENTIKVEKIKSIKYEFENKNKIYYPDFYIKDKTLIVEIKSWYTYVRDLNKNLVKQKACIYQGYDFVFIVDKNYNEFKTITSS